MIRKLMKLMGLAGAPATQSQPMGLPTPYRQAEINYIYNLLFCDDLSQFKPKAGEPLTYWQAAFFGEPPAPKAVRKIAEDTNEESRIRVLAFNWLREHNEPVPRQLLGAIVELPLDGGLDVLAAYPDGRVRYINQTGKLAVFEGGPPQVEEKAKSLVASAMIAVNRIGPWDKARLPPPAKGNIRMTFLVSDGLYFGEGPIALMQRDAMGGPVVHAATELLQLVVSLALDERP
jgi:hypothetical protein